MKKALLLTLCLGFAFSVQADLQFRNTTIKEVGGKYRYFFHVTNSGDDLWVGNVTVGYVAEAITMPRITRKELRILSGEGTSFFVDWTVAPASWGQHGEYGIKKWIMKYGSKKTEVPVK